MAESSLEFSPKSTGSCSLKDSLPNGVKLSCNLSQNVLCTHNADSKRHENIAMGAKNRNARRDARLRAFTCVGRDKVILTRQWPPTKTQHEL